MFRSQPIRWLDFQERKLGQKEYLTDRLNHEAVEFIEKNKDNPFFLFLSHYAPHTILNGKPRIVAKYRAKHQPGKSTREKCYLCQDATLEGDPQNHWAGNHNPHLAAMLESIDDGVGLILAKLKSLNLDRNTIVIFTSDNGGETQVTSNAPLRGGKSQLYEGGIRVPLIVSWPDTIASAHVSLQTTSNVDFYPTLLEAAKIPAGNKQTLDGVSLLNTWIQPEAFSKQRALFWHYPLEKRHFLGGTSSGAIRLGKWKLIESFTDDSIELYNLNKDPSESTNLAVKKPILRKAMLKRLIDWRKSLGATKAPPKR